MAKFRKGDVCTIEVVVTSSFNETQVCVKPVDGYSDIYLKPKDLTMKRPKIEVGDRVKLASMDRFGAAALGGVVKAVDGDRLWVERDSQMYDTWEISRVRRVDPDDPQVADAVPADPPPTSPAADAIVMKHQNIAGAAA